MRKILVILIFLIFITGCQNNYKEKQTTDHLSDDKVLEDVIPEYVDENPLKIALYKRENDLYVRKDYFLSKLEHFKDIGLFSIILDDQEQVKGLSVNSLYHDYLKKYSDINFKIGYNINFSLSDGTIFNETILKPLDVFAYPFSDYLYIWLYDDINNTGTYSHLEEADYNEKTVMSSIKLMSTSLSDLITSNIKVTVFTYDTEDDFIDGNYRGNSKFTMEIVRNN